MKLLWRYVLVVAALMAGSLLLSACGGGEEELDLDEYFRRFEDITDAADTSMDRLVSEGVGEDIEATRDYFDSFDAILRQALNDVKDIHPPAEARAAHDEFVAGGAEMLASFEDFSDRLAEVESPSGLAALFAEPMPALDAAQQRVTDACLQLQEIADENGIEVDLECEE